MKSILRIYDFWMSHKQLFWGCMLSCFALCGIAGVNLEYKEDVTDFLPLTAQQRLSLEYYQQISRGDQIVILFEGGDIDSKLDAVDCFARLAQEQDSVIAANLTTQIDTKRYWETLRWVYANIPYFLTEADYTRIDTILKQPGVVEQGIDNCLRVMQMPVSGFVHHVISYDPLSLFSPVVNSLREFQPVSNRFSSMDGYMLTEDEKIAFAFCHSPYGARETGMNTKLVHNLQDLCRNVQNDYPDVNVRLLGAPVVAVENASCIKRDSMLSLTLALLLIITVLCYCFRKDLRAILLIVMTIVFGWLFALAVLRITIGGVSIIVLGIGSIIIGIAVNYPLHILYHQRYTSSTRQTLQEIVAPLVIGNITTVGAFLSLIPLDAIALRDLGVFAASMLVGTILFSILFLPPLMKQPAGLSAQTPRQQAISSSEIKPSLRYMAIGGIVLLSAVFWYVGRDMSFDADVSHINYMTSQQRADFAYLTSLTGETGLADIYIVESQAEVTNPGSFSNVATVQTVLSPWRWLPDKEEQQLRIVQWNTFWKSRREFILHQLQAESSKHGFSQYAFTPFKDLLQSDIRPQPFDYFRPMAENMMLGYWVEDSTQISLVTRICVSKQQLSTTEQQICDCVNSESNVFDIYSLNESLAKQLSDNFDYIGIVCSLLVFVFLWISFHSLRAAFVAFLPMAISWIWIMGIMHLIGLQFNIVNVILATFIFGQGDDYTIFVVEGLQYEHATGKRMLPQYRRSIILSAVIMFAGIGVLVIARHPAMFSLGAVTLIGMAVVVLLVNIIPPLMKQILFKSSKCK